MEHCQDLENSSSPKRGMQKGLVELYAVSQEQLRILYGTDDKTMKDTHYAPFLFAKQPSKLLQVDSDSHL